MGVYLSSDLRSRLIEADNQHCAYCHTREAIIGQSMTIDHVIPESLGGLTEFENLCFCCRRCNEFKGADGWLLVGIRQRRNDCVNQYRWA